VFVTASHYPPCLIFAGKAESLPLNMNPEGAAIGMSPTLGYQSVLTVSQFHISLIFVRKVKSPPKDWSFGRGT
jgi:hypothetical protein